MSGLIKGVKQALLSDVEHPVHEVKKEGDGFELRSYGETKWVSTKVQGRSHKDTTTKGFWKLFNYIQGKNERNDKIEMTAPVAIRVEPGKEAYSDSTFTVSFFIGKDCHDDPAKPSNPELF